MKTLCAAVILLSAQSLPAAALTVNSGDILRGSYTFPTFGATTLEPISFLLRVSSQDLFGAGDSVGVRYLDGALTPVSFTRFDSVGTGLDPTIGIIFDPSDVLPPATMPVVPRSGFVEIEGLSGSFDVLSLDLSALEPVSGSTLLRRTTVSDFERVEQSLAPVPLPAAGALLVLAMAGAFGVSRLGRGRPCRADA
ncbi:hypothetical protein [uncultured Roseobacter sp.]|uniref:hypothetical protein n=1 Tax=uncultured Roseobacter sp. TaxID=114847 RepID=UPI0026395ADC|nr:hypothetical protein [uncultured Roseobacter sp.]